jgi:hypothetical protein
MEMEKIHWMLEIQLWSYLFFKIIFYANVSQIGLKIDQEFSCGKVQNDTHLYPKVLFCSFLNAISDVVELLYVVLS